MDTAVVLLRSRSFFGANIVNIPALFFIKKYLKAKELHVLSDKNLTYFYKQIAWIEGHAEPKNFWQTLRNIPKNTDFIYSMRPSMDGAPFIKYLKGIPLSVGLSVRSAYLNRLFDHHTPCDTEQYRALTHLQPLLHLLAIDTSPLLLLREAMLSFVQDTKPSNSICIMPGAGGGEHKKWGIEKYWTVMQQLYLDFPHMSFQIILGPNEKQEKQFLLEHAPASFPMHFQENLSLPALITIVENSRLTISNDCGPSHISQCLVKPFIGLYYQSNPEWFLPHSHSQMLCPPDLNIQNIPIELVIKISRDLLNKNNTPCSK